MEDRLCNRLILITKIAQSFHRCQTEVLCICRTNAVAIASLSLDFCKTEISCIGILHGVTVGVLWFDYCQAMIARIGISNGVTVRLASMSRASFKDYQ